MAEELINEIFDLPALKKQQDEVLKIIKETADAVAGFTTDSAKQKSDAGNAKTLNEIKKAAEAAANTYEKLKKKTSELSAEEQALQRTRKQLIRVQAQQTEEGQKLMTNLANERAGLKELTHDQNMAARAARSHTDYTKAFSKQLDLANMNVSEMQQELSRLNRMSFSGLSPEQIEKVKAKMSILKEEIGDFNKRISASGDKTTVMIGAMQGLTSIAQVGTGVMSAFGIENERLEKAMVQLIGVSQALTTIHELREKGTLRDTAAIIKNTAAQYLNITATQVQALTQKASTASTYAGAIAFKVMGTAMKALPIVALIAGVGALAFGIYKLIESQQEQMSVMKMTSDLQEKQGENAAGELVQTEALIVKLKSAKNNKEEYSKVVKMWNEKYGKEYNASLSDTVFNLDAITTAANKARQAILKKALAAAAEEKLKEVIGDNLAQYQKYVSATETLDLKRKALAENEAWNAELLKNGQIELYNANKGYTQSLKDQIAAGYERYGLDEDYIKEVGILTNMVADNTDVNDSNTETITKNTNATTDNTAAKKEALQWLKELYGVMLSEPEKIFAKYESEWDKADQLYADRLISYDDYLSAYAVINRKYFDEIDEFTRQVDAARAATMSTEPTAINTDLMMAVLKDDAATVQKLMDEKKISADEYDDALSKIQAHLKGMQDEEKEQAATSIELMQKRIDTISNYADRAMSLYGAINAYQSQLSENEQAELQARLDAGLISQEQYDARVSQIQAEAAERNKAFAAAQVVIDTAKSIMSIWGDPSLPTIAKIVFSALAGATGAFQLATINAQTIPGYYTGRDGGDAEFAYVGERGTEAVIDNGSVWFTPPTKTLTYLPENASVLTAAETVRAMQAGMFTNSTVESAPDKLDELIRVVKNKKEFNFEVTEKGLGMTAKKAANYMYYINRNCRA